MSALIRLSSPVSEVISAPSIQYRSERGELSHLEQPTVVFWVYQGNGSPTQYEYTRNQELITRMAQKYLADGFTLMTPLGRCLDPQDAYHAVEEYQYDKLILCRRTDLMKVGNLLGFGPDVDNLERAELYQLRALEG
jgi:hypothetical protein